MKTGHNIYLVKIKWSRSEVVLHTKWYLVDAYSLSDAQEKLMRQIKEGKIDLDKSKIINEIDKITIEYEKMEVIE